MKAARPKPTTVDDYIAALPTDQQATAQAVREAVLSAEPDIRESIKWAQPVYEVNGPVVAMKAFARHVTLTFWRGAALAEGGAVLAGEGDRMRHVRFANTVEVDAEAIRDLVRQAAALNHDLGDPTRR